MAVSVLLSGMLKNGMVDQFTQMCSDSLDSTRKSYGCHNINLTYHTNERIRNHTISSFETSGDMYIENMLDWLKHNESLFTISIHSITAAQL